MTVRSEEWCSPVPVGRIRPVRCDFHGLGGDELVLTGAACTGQSIVLLGDGFWCLMSTIVQR